MYFKTFKTSEDGISGPPFFNGTDFVPILCKPNIAIDISLSLALSAPCSSAGIDFSINAVNKLRTSGDESSIPCSPFNAIQIFTG